MTKEEFLKYPEDLIERYNKPLDLVSKFMTPNGQDSSNYKEKILSEIDGFFCNVVDEKTTNGGGNCQLGTHIKYKGNILVRKLKSIANRINDDICFSLYVTLSDYNSMSSFTKKYTANHEINHADTYLYKEINKKKNSLYYGLSKIIYLPFGKGVVIGKNINETTNEVYNQYQLYLENPEVFKHIKSVDELIYSIPPCCKGAECYYEINIFSKLLLVACDNDLTVPYSSLLDNDEIFVEKTVDLNGHKVIKNDLLYAGKYNCMEFEKHFNKLCGGPGYYSILCIFYDNLYEEIRKTYTISENSLSGILTVIDKYKTAKYKKMEELGFWDKEKREYHERIYSEYRAFIEEINAKANKNKQEKDTKETSKKKVKVLKNKSTNN